jgi:hypothetical protein
MTEQRTFVRVHIGGGRSLDHHNDIRAAVTKSLQDLESVDFLDFEVMPQPQAHALITRAEAEIAAQKAATGDGG